MLSHLKDIAYWDISALEHAYALNSYVGVIFTLKK